MLNQILIIAAYVLGTFYLQKLYRSKHPAGKRRHYVVSLLLYSVFFAVFGPLFSGSLTNVFLYSLLVLATHFIFFIGQSNILEKRLKGFTVFIFTHGSNIFLLLISVHILFSGSATYNLLTEALSTMLGDKAEIYPYLILSLLICAIPSSELVRNAMSYFCTRSGPGSAKEEDDSTGLGTVIGIYERVIIMVLGFMGWYIAIAFVITAKSLARFEKFKDPPFAERFIIGTFTSILVPVVLLFIMEQVL
jgi:hypothetical protein